MESALERHEPLEGHTLFLDKDGVVVMEEHQLTSDESGFITNKRPILSVTAAPGLHEVLNALRGIVWITLDGIQSGTSNLLCGTRLMNQDFYAVCPNPTETTNFDDLVIAGTKVYRGMKGRLLPHSVVIEHYEDGWTCYFTGSLVDISRPKWGAALAVAAPATFVYCSEDFPALEDASDTSTVVSDLTTSTFGTSDSTVSHLLAPEQTKKLEENIHSLVKEFAGIGSRDIEKMIRGITKEIVREARRGVAA